MTFRDDIDAAYARLEPLESENRKLVEENARLRGIPVPAQSPIPVEHDAVLERIAYLEQRNPRVAAENESFRNGAPVPRAEPPPKPWPTELSDGSTLMLVLIPIAIVLVIALAGALA